MHAAHLCACLSPPARKKKKFWGSWTTLGIGNIVCVKDHSESAEWYKAEIIRHKKPAEPIFIPTKAQFNVLAKCKLSKLSETEMISVIAFQETDDHWTELKVGKCEIKLTAKET